MGNGPDTRLKSLADYSLLGRSGLRVSPLCLGTMTFGTEWGWGADADASRAMFRRYLEAGGNFVDTADGYTNGRSEELVGQFMKEMGNRFRLVVYDEAHYLPGPSQHESALDCLAPMRLGLTATPARADGRHALLESLIGPVVFEESLAEARGRTVADYSIVRVPIYLTEIPRQYEPA